MLAKLLIDDEFCFGEKLKLISEDWALKKNYCCVKLLKISEKIKEIYIMKFVILRACY